MCLLPMGKDTIVIFSWFRGIITQVVQGPYTIYHPENCACSLCSSIFLTMNKLVSKNLSTQFVKQLSSPRENRVEGVPVMHLNDTP